MDHSCLQLVSIVIHPDWNFHFDLPEVVLRIWKPPSNRKASDASTSLNQTEDKNRILDEIGLWFAHEGQQKNIAVRVVSLGFDSDGSWGRGALS